MTVLVVEIKKEKSQSPVARNPLAECAWCWCRMNVQDSEVMAWVVFAHFELGRFRIQGTGHPTSLT